MNRVIGLCVVATASAARAGVFGVGDVAVVEDTTGNIHANVDLMSFTIPDLDVPTGQERFCRDTAKVMLPAFGDQFDGIVTFTPRSLEGLNMSMQVQMGQTVRTDHHGTGAMNVDIGAKFGSAAKLSHCVFMGSMPMLPSTPDGPMTLLGIPSGLTGVEMVGHEYGHHWLNYMMFDKNDGLGQLDLLRGFDTSSCPEDSNFDCMGGGVLNGHYAYWVDSHSVMYGNFVTDNHNGTVTARGGVRGYNKLDQYMMGLRPACEVPPILATDDGSHHGPAGGAMANLGNADTSPMTNPIHVSVDDIIRALGPRTPAYPDAQSCWRVAFVMVVPPGETYKPADVATVDAFRRRFSDWFSVATDQRGTMDTRLSGTGCLSNSVLPPPACPGSDDAGTVQPDDDAGVVDPGTPDAGTPVSEMPPMTMKPTPDDIAKLKPKCGCGSVSAAPLLLLAALLRRARRTRAH